MIKLAFLLEFLERSERLLHRHFGVDAGTFKQIDALRASELLIDEIDAPREILGPLNQGERPLSVARAGRSRTNCPRRVPCISVPPFFE